MVQAYTKIAQDGNDSGDHSSDSGYLNPAIYMILGILGILGHSAPTCTAWIIIIVLSQESVPGYQGLTWAGNLV